MTLQLLVENAVKHNAISKDQPLLVYISAKDNTNLLVYNTKTSAVKPISSFRVGLENIHKRYSFFTKENVFSMLELVRPKNVVVVFLICQPKQVPHIQNAVIVEARFQDALCGYPYPVAASAKCAAEGCNNANIAGVPGYFIMAGG